MNVRKITTGLALAGLLVSGSAQAALVDRGGGMLYDDVLNITWLQDANYAKTSGYDADGRMTWSAAKTWADNLDYGGYSDWRLVSNSNLPNNDLYDYSYDGSTDQGYNITRTSSELSYMYYVNLGLKGLFDENGVSRSDYGVFGNGTGDGVNENASGQNGVGLVRNVQSTGYWYDQTFWPGTWWGFDMKIGLEDMIGGPINEYYVWLVRNGDVAAALQNDVPEPMMAAQLGVGLAGIGLVRRRRSLGAS